MLTHGTSVTWGTEEGSAQLRQQFAVASSTDPVGRATTFDFLFPGLQDDADNLLPEGPTTVAKLVALGRTMRDPGPAAADDPGNTSIPAAYTYLGQFVAHDLTLEAKSASMAQLTDPGLQPLTRTEIRSALSNLRTPTLELDQLYGGLAARDPENPDRMALGVVSSTGSATSPDLRPPGKGDDNDLPRRPLDRVALIGDPREDENLILAQLHVAFLKAHNALVAEGRTFDQARRVLRQHYQHVVVHDLLVRVADPAIVEAMLGDGSRVFDPGPDEIFLPLEFSAAAYRFGHSMIAGAYDFNANFNVHGGVPATLSRLFALTALRGDLGGAATLPESWIIQWERLIDDGGPFNRARRIDTKLVEPLLSLAGPQGADVGDAGNLAVLDLVRGYRLRLPTGQAVAAKLDLEVLTPGSLERAAASPEQVAALRAGDFLDRTPLWYYVLAEASASGGHRLGPVGSTIVAAVLIGLARRSEDSIFDQPDWSPTLPSAIPGTFQLRDLLALAGVLPDLVTVPQPGR